MRAVLQSQRLVGRGVKVPASIDWTELMKTKLARFNPWPAETKEIIAKTHDIEVGYASFTDDQTIVVNGNEYQADHIIIATGQRPHRLDIPGKELLHNSTDVLSLQRLPEEVAFIGAGYVSMELATLLAAAGARVTIIDHSDQPLRAFPHQVVRTIIEEMTKRGIKFVYNTNVESVQKRVMISSLKLMVMRYKLNMSLMRLVGSLILTSLIWQLLV